MTKIISKKLLVFVLAILCFVTAINFPVSVKADSNSFDNTNVLDDLRSSEDFNILKYPFSMNKELKVINFVEYCYSYRENMRANYGLYIYVYNPKGLNFDKGNANYIQMAVSYDENGNPTEYKKFGLKYLSRSEESVYKNLFYKFKVIDREINGTTFIDRVNSNERRYDVSGIELLTEGKNLATEYAVAGSYRFTGYAKGYGPDDSAESNLTCQVKELETITLDVHSTFYRTGEYATNHRHDLTSVYFSVPNRFFESYGALQKIKAEWYEYQTTPIVITSNGTVCDLLSPYIGVNVNDANIPIQIYTGYQEIMDGSGHHHKYNWAYNCNYTNYVNTRCDVINYLFTTEGKSISQYVLSSERIKNYVENYNKSFVNGLIDVPGKTISADLFEEGLSFGRENVDYIDEDIHHKLVNFDAGDTFDMLNYESTTTGWQRFFAGLFGLAPRELDDSYLGVSPIRIVTDEDISNPNIARELLINGNEKELNEFKAFYNEAKRSDETVVLFRFAQTDYECLPVICFNAQAGRNLSGNYGNDTYVVSESVFLNFDVIELTFNKEGNYTVIPVVNSPIDIYNDITLPKKAVNWLEIILFIILLLVVLMILSATGILPLIFKAIFYVILLPFKAIGLIIKSIKKGRQ